MPTHRHHLQPRLRVGGCGLRCRVCICHLSLQLSHTLLSGLQRGLRRLQLGLQRRRLLRGCLCRSHSAGLGLLHSALRLLQLLLQRLGRLPSLTQLPLQPCRTLLLRSQLGGSLAGLRLCRRLRLLGRGSCSLRLRLGSSRSRSRALGRRLGSLCGDLPLLRRRLSLLGGGSIGTHTLIVGGSRVHGALVSQEAIALLQRLARGCSMTHDCQGLAKG